MIRIVSFISYDKKHKKKALIHTDVWHIVFHKKDVEYFLAVCIHTIVIILHTHPDFMLVLQRTSIAHKSHNPLTCNEENFVQGYCSSTQSIQQQAIYIHNVRQASTGKTCIKAEHFTESTMNHSDIINIVNSISLAIYFIWQY